MSIKAEIIADSINSKDCRLTTFLLEFPRFILAELATHRMFSKNAASSRAIPIEKMIQQVINNPAMPVWWGKNQSGMQAKEELDNNTRNHFSSSIRIPEYKDYYCGLSSGPFPNYIYNLTQKEQAQAIWLQARDAAIAQVKKLHEIGLHKQIANRILEPWFNIRIILSGTEFENFFALRAHPDAQPEIQALAYKMLEEYNKSEPKKLNEGEWHIPFGDKIDIRRMYDLQKKEDDIIGMYDPKWDMIKIAVARCARISYLNYEGNDDYGADIKLCDRLFGSIPRHLSPAEHVAQAMDNSDFIGNFRGFKQYRKMFDDENLEDSRVKK